MPDSECSAPAFFKQCVAVSFPLAIIGKTTAQTATEFDRSSRQLLSDCRNTTKQFRDAFADIREMIGFLGCCQIDRHIRRNCSHKNQADNADPHPVDVSMLVGVLNNRRIGVLCLGGKVTHDQEGYECRQVGS